jgi:protein SCO1/2
VQAILRVSIFLLLLLFLPVPRVAAELVEGVVTAVDQERRRLTLRLDGAAAASMELPAGRGDLAIARPGWAIRGELVMVGGERRIQTIFPNDPQGRATLALLTAQLRRDTLQRGSRAFRNVGEFLPRFALWAQDGTLFLSESLKGNYTVINFIFTRCPDPRMCPASTSRMRELQQAARERGWNDFQLVSITLDPEFDTPGVFAAYAADNGLDTANFSLLGGPREAIEDLKRQLGVLAEPDPEQIVRHTISTALVDPEGRIIYRLPGSMWDPQVFLRQVDRDRERRD